MLRVFTPNENAGFEKKRCNRPLMNAFMSLLQNHEIWMRISHPLKYHATWLLWAAAQEWKCLRYQFTLLYKFGLTSQKCTVGAKNRTLFLKIVIEFFYAWSKKAFTQKKTFHNASVLQFYATSPFLQFFNTDFIQVIAASQEEHGSLDERYGSFSHRVIDSWNFTIFFSS